MTNEEQGAAEVNTVTLSDERDVRAATAGNQSEFPYDRGEEARVTRREFCNFLGLTSAALFAGAAGFAAKAAADSRQSPNATPRKIDGAELLPPGASLNFRYPTERDTAILVRSSDGEYHAYGQKCTHLSCPVYFERATNRLECPCHQGAYDVGTGGVLFGPPPRPLDQIVLEVRAGGEVWAVDRRANGDERPV